MKPSTQSIVPVLHSDLAIRKGILILEIPNAVLDVLLLWIEGGRHCLM